MEESKAKGIDCGKKITDKRPVPLYKQSLYTSSGLNQYSMIGPAAQLHDADGNQLTAPVSPIRFPIPNTTRYLWDGENRLRGQFLVANPSDIPYRFNYDPFGRRIMKMIDGRTTLFIYDGWNLVAEYTPDLSQTSHYLWGKDLSGSMQGAGGVGGLLSQRVGGTLTYPTYDGNGNVTEYLGVTGTIMRRAQYDPFGILVSLSYTSPFGFSTKYEDSETGLLYYGYRYYDPRQGRWLNRDPMGEGGGININCFVGNDGINFSDYLGLRPDPDCVLKAFNDHSLRNMKINNEAERALGHPVRDALTNAGGGMMGGALTGAGAGVSFAGIGAVPGAVGGMIIGGIGGMWKGYNDYSDAAEKHKHDLEESQEELENDLSECPCVED